MPGSPAEALGSGRPDAGTSHLEALLRSLPSVTGVAPAFDPGQAPEDPIVLFRGWFAEAVEAGAPEPHAMTLSTVDADGAPDARVLILKALEADRFAFASGADSAKGRQLAGAPSAALSFWWQPLARSVRIRGRVEEGTEDERRADFLARSASARAIAFVGAQSTRLDDPAVFADQVVRARRTVDADLDAVPSGWRRWWLVADTVEFWQGDPSRQHLRLQYRRAGRGWTHHHLRP